MDFSELMRIRCTVRKYQPKPVEEAKLLQILEAARVAPTAANRQPLKLLVVQSTDGLEKLGEAAKYHNAPLAIIVCADRETVWVRNSYDNKDMLDIDGSIVTDHMMLEAANLSLGSCWIANFNPEVLVEKFNIPNNYEPISILSIGYPAGELKSPNRHSIERKSIDGLVVYDHFK